MKKTLFLLMGLFSLFPLFSQDLIDVSVQGISDGIKNSKQQDRDEAEMDAKLKAIERAGVNIRSLTEVENFVLKKDLVQSKAAAYLMPGFQIIDIGYGADGLYHVVLTGKVRSINSVSDGHILRSVTIGDQVWSAENLDVDHYRNGDLIPHIQDPGKWETIKYGAWCYYSNDPEYGKMYGKLYNWYAINDPRGLAPAGWHIPRIDEWQKLSNYLGGNEILGSKIKSSLGWLSDGNGNNSSGFSALPASYRNTNGTFAPLGYDVIFWSSSEYSSYSSWGWYLDCFDSDTHRPDYHKNSGFSVRLVRD